MKKNTLGRKSLELKDVPVLKGSFLPARMGRPRSIPAGRLCYTHPANEYNSCPEEMNPIVSSRLTLGRGREDQRHILKLLEREFVDDGRGLALLRRRRASCRSGTIAQQRVRRQHGDCSGKQSDCDKARDHQTVHGKPPFGEAHPVCPLARSSTRECELNHRPRSRFPYRLVARSRNCTNAARSCSEPMRCSGILVPGV
jgi:hypothetical protein